MGRQRCTSSPRPEPATPSQAALLAWLRGPPRRSQLLLAVVCRVSQQLISAYANRRLRPEPGGEAARLLEIATGRRVTVAGWLIPQEVVERDERNAQAAAFARAVASGAHIELVPATLNTLRLGGTAASRKGTRRNSSTAVKSGKVGRLAARRAR